MATNGRQQAQENDPCSPANVQNMRENHGLDDEHLGNDPDNNDHAGDQ